jgi:hypothetical protein
MARAGTGVPIEMKAGFDRGERVPQTARRILRTMAL